MSDLTEKTQARCEQARGQGRKATWFVIEDIQQLLDEHEVYRRSCEQLEDDNVDILGRWDDLIFEVQRG